MSVQTLDKATSLLESLAFHVVIADISLAAYRNLKGLFRKPASIIITGPDEQKLEAAVRDWPGEFFVETIPFALPCPEDDALHRLVGRASDHAAMKMEITDLKSTLALSEAKVKEVYAEIKDLEGIINEGFVKELERRISIEAKFIWFQKERQKIEKILRKIYTADDVNSLLDVIPDIKDLIQAGGASIYILDENDTIGKYLKPLVWDDTFLPHAEFSKYIARLDSQDFAAAVARYGREINASGLAVDKKMSKRYLENLTRPLKSILCVPIMHDKEVIGVVEVYNKTAKGEAIKEGFSKEDQQILRGLSEHISLAMTKLNLIQYDALTGLLRPDPFFEKVLQKINSQSKRRQEEGAHALVMGDVDWFKDYNDRNGHEAGNKLLRELSHVLKLSIREEDLLCRYGGEEFLFFLTGVKSLEEACLLTERIRKNVEERYFEHQEFQPRNNLTMSFGVTLLPRRTMENPPPMGKVDLKKLAHEADQAMAEAKGKRTPGLAAQGKDEKALTKNKVCAYLHEEIEENRGGVIRAFKERYFGEKRKSQRFYTSTILMYKENGAFRASKTVNLSEEGAKIISESRLPPAKTIDTIIVLGSMVSTGKSEVVYSEKASIDSPFFYTGLKFKDMPVLEKKNLEEYLAPFRKRESPN